MTTETDNKNILHVYNLIKEHNFVYDINTKSFLLTLKLEDIENLDIDDILKYKNNCFSVYTLKALNNTLDMDVISHLDIDDHYNDLYFYNAKKEFIEDLSYETKDGFVTLQIIINEYHLFGKDKIQRVLVLHAKNQTVAKYLEVNDGKLELVDTENLDNFLNKTNTTHLYPEVVERIKNMTEATKIHDDNHAKLQALFE